MNKQTGKNGKDLRIAVIGAGASGLTAAHTLKKLGYGNVTVFEKNPDAGGKVKTVSYKGKKYEMGAVIVSPEYDTVLGFAEELGIRADSTAITGTTFMVDEKGERMAFRDFLKNRYGYAGTALSFLRFMRVINRYNALYSCGFCDAPEDLHRPYSEFARARGIDAVSEVLRPIMTGLGYGFYEEVPALYVMKLLKWLFSLAIRDSANALAGTNFATVRKFPEGFQRIWEELAKDATVLFRSPVEKIQRKGEGEIAVTAAGRKRLFDRLIISTHLDTALHIMNTTKEEMELFGKIRYYNYRVSMVRVAGMSDDTLYLRRNSYPHRMGHVTATDRPHSGDDILVAYQLVDPKMPKREMNRVLFDDFRELGGRPGRIVKEITWDYFPHVKTADLDAGFYRRIDALQGKRGTYYIGGIMNFETVEHTASFARKLVLRHFGE